jgi:hypothetical protein
VVFFELQEYQSMDIQITNLDHIINNYYIYDSTTHLPVNFYNIPGTTNGLYIQSKKDANYKQLKEIPEYQNNLK